MTFCLVPGKGAVLTLPGYAGEGDGATGCSHVCSKSHNTLTEMALSPGTLVVVKGKVNKARSNRTHRVSNHFFVFILFPFRWY